MTPHPKKVKPEQEHTENCECLYCALNDEHFGSSYDGDCD